MMNNCAAIIVTFNPDVEKIKMQLLRLSSQVKFFIIVDNNSENLNELSEELSKIVDNNKFILIKNKENKGLGFAQNKGIKHAFTLDVTYILMFDDDSLVEDDFVEMLTKTHEELLLKGNRIGAIGPIYFNKETKEQYPVTKYIGPFIARKLPKNQPVEASFLISSGCLISIDVLNDVGLMNEDFFIDYIDVEWSFRAISKGYKLYATPKAQMNHIIGEKRISVLGRKISLHSPLRKYYLFRNSILMIRCPYISSGYKLREIVFNGLRFIVYMVLSNEKRRFFKYSIVGCLDGLKGKTGKCIHNY